MCQFTGGLYSMGGLYSGFHGILIAVHLYFLMFVRILDVPVFMDDTQLFNFISTLALFTVLFNSTHVLYSIQFMLFYLNQLVA